MALSAGTNLNPYVIDSFISSGGMGEVYKAHDPRLGRDVAIKLLPAGLSDHPEFRLRFENEIQAISRLSHKNVCTLYDAGVFDGRPFIVMELLEGQTLEEVLEGGPLEVSQILHIGIQVADALEAAHSEGIVHRDIKPSNIFLNSRGDAKVVDFGIATTVRSHMEEEADGDTLTVMGATVGTVSYMSPEQARGERVDARADVFSLGVVLYQMATGTLPFSGSPTAILAQIVTPTPVPSLRSTRPSLPQELDRVIRRAMEKDKSVRYQTARDLLAAFRGLRRDLLTGTGQSMAASPPAPQDPPAGAKRPFRAHWIWGLAAVLAIALGVWVAAGAHLRGPIRTMAVLPCATSVDGPGMDYLCDLLAARLINTLSQIPVLEVQSQQAARPLTGENLGVVEFGRALGVDAVLTAELRETAEELSVAVEVTDVRTGAHVWGDVFQRPATERDGVHEAIALEVAENLQLRLDAAEEQRLRLYHKYQQAQYFWSQRTAESLQRAAGLFRDVIREDPRFVEAHVGLASSYILLSYYGGLAPSESYESARRAAEDALRLDETSAEAHASLALVLRDYDRDWRGAQVEFERALTLNPRSVSALQWYAELLAMTGRFQEAERRIRQAEQADALNLTVRAVHGWILLCAGRYREAEEKLQATMEMDPAFHISYWFLGQLHIARGEYPAAIQALTTAAELAGRTSRPIADLAIAQAMNGNREEARGLLAELQRMARDGENVSHYEYALVHVGLGEYDEAIAELEGALAERTWQVANMGIDPLLQPLRNDPRYERLLRSVGLPSD